MAALLVAAAILWLRTTINLFSPPGLVCEGCADDWFRRLQLVLALAGIVCIGVSVAYLVHIALSGRTWRHRRVVGLALAVTMAAWSALVLVYVWT